MPYVEFQDVENSLTEQSLEEKQADISTKERLQEQVEQDERSGLEKRRIEVTTISYHFAVTAAMTAPTPAPTRMLFLL